MKSNRILLVVAFSTVLNALVAIADDPESSKKRTITDFGLPKELVGEWYFPSAITDIPKANWMILPESPEAEEDNPVVSLRLYGFRTKDKKIDWTTKDKTILHRIETGLRYGHVFRPAISDFSEGTGAWGAGAFRGVMLVERKLDRFVVGISAVGYFLGVSFGTEHQLFHAPLLTMELDRLLRETHSYQIPQKELDELSGLVFFKNAEDIFEFSRDP